MKNISKMLQTAVCLTLVVQLAGCGTLMYPERRGQRSGRVDVGVAVLDGIGLFFFLIPGIIAFAVDFSEGTIYLPAGALSSLNLKEIKVAKFDPRHANAATIEAIVRRETGQRVTLNQDTMQVARLGSLEEMKTRFAEASPTEKNMRVALNVK